MKWAERLCGYVHCLKRKLTPTALKLFGFTLVAFAIQFGHDMSTFGHLDLFALSWCNVANAGSSVILLMEA